jgi:hypothetical protein
MKINSRFNIYLYWLLSYRSINPCNIWFIYIIIWSQTVVKHIYMKKVRIFWFYMSKPMEISYNNIGWNGRLHVKNVLNDYNFILFELLSYLNETGKLSNGNTSQLHILLIHNNTLLDLLDLLCRMLSMRTSKHECSLLLTLITSDYIQYYLLKVLTLTFFVNYYGQYADTILDATNLMNYSICYYVWDSVIDIIYNIAYLGADIMMHSSTTSLIFDICLFFLMYLNNTYFKNYLVYLLFVYIHSMAD